MKLLPIIGLILLTSCGKEYIDQTRTISNTEFVETSVEAPKHVLSYYEYDKECVSGLTLGNPKRFNSVLKMDVKTHHDTNVITLSDKIWVDLEDNALLVYNPYHPTETTQVIELEDFERISLQITAKSGKVILEVEEKSLDLGLTEIPENVGFCRNDGKFVHSVEIFDVLE